MAKRTGAPPKEETIDQIVNRYHEFHQARGKSFKERMGAFEKFHDEDNIEGQRIRTHAQYVAFGNPDNRQEFPGAYDLAHRKLSEFAPNDGDKLEDEDQLAQILESYVDNFLGKTMGERFDKVMERAAKELKGDKENLSAKDKKELRALKGQLMSQYYSEDGEHPTNILHEQYISALKGKKKVELIAKLRNIGETSSQLYAGKLQMDILGNLFSEEDRYVMAEHLGAQFKKKGWKHKKLDHVFRDVGTQTEHYTHLLHGDGDKLKKVGYKPIQENEARS